VIVLDASAVLDWLLQHLSGSASSSASILLGNPCMLRTSWTLRSPRYCGVWRGQGRFRPVAPMRRFRTCWTSPLRGIPTSCSCPGFGNSVTIFPLIPRLCVVPAEKLGARLLTRDGRLAAAPGHATIIEVFERSAVFRSVIRTARPLC
jgi:hypothetical protein